MTRPTTENPAWVFILQHAQAIERYSRANMFRIRGIDPNDFQQDLCLDLVTAFDLFDPTRSDKARPCPYCSSQGCRSWIKSRASLTRLRLLRVRSRNVGIEQRQRTKVTSMDPMCNLVTMFERHHDANQRVAERYTIANETQTVAMQTVLEDWSTEDINEKLGITRAARNWRLRKLRDRTREQGAA